MMNIVLLGDSILDNGAYVGGGTDVAGHLRLLAPTGTTVTLCAVDGSTVADVPSQIPCLPENATHLVLSAGGNDALAHAHVLTREPTTAIDVLEYLAAAVENFGLEYRAVVRSLRALGKPLVASH